MYGGIVGVGDFSEEISPNWREASPMGSVFLQVCDPRMEPRVPWTRLLSTGIKMTVPLGAVRDSNDLASRHV